VSFWKNRDPRAKTLAALVLSFALAMAPVSRTLIVLPGVLILLLTTGMGRGQIWKVIQATLLLWGLSFLANAFLMPGIRVGPEGLGWLRPTEEGIRAGFGHGARLACLTALSAWVVSTTGALELSRSLEWGVRGIPPLRLAAHRALLPVVLSLRMIPMFTQEAQRLLDVDRLRSGPRRGVEGARRIARLAPVWIVTVVDRAEALALALTLRGYRPEGHRGFATGFRMNWADWGLLAVSLTAVFWLGGQ
jgi:energy-coupling factor transporter transmembrane protein EcfT